MNYVIKVWPERPDTLYIRALDNESLKSSGCKKGKESFKSRRKETCGYRESYRNKHLHGLFLHGSVSGAVISRDKNMSKGKTC